MRAFIALRLPDHVRGSLAALQREFAASGADVKWVEAPNLHVTLKFLGEVSGAQRTEVEAMLRDAGARTAPFPAALRDIGAFPSVNSPRVIWSGMDAGRENATRLAERIEAGSRAIGLEAEERPFAAHVTLGRVRSPRRRGALVRALKAIAWSPPPPWQVETLTLYQSALSSAGPSYTVLDEIPLSGAKGEG
jgi:2'-5' RNA ligase